MNTRWIILFLSLIYLLLLNNQAEAFGGPKLVAKRRFSLERVVQHQDPGQETTKPLDYEGSIPVEREVRQKEKDDPNLEANEWMY
ncbi:unnamed protein product [Pocillopora meandrina]|uniref:Uncharacterized protein n=1 Tax=Pocillopora meandrina TaxID=46732 RepID=A0AAU9WS89_9CNID|nr:unnamed protein product [Pocillopora meandrina]